MYRTTGDLHSGLETKEIGQLDAGGVEFRLVRIQNSKTDVRFGLHANPHTSSSAGFQLTDFLSYLGFQRGDCAFTTGRQCYARSVGEGFDLGKFGIAFVNSFNTLEEAERHLDKCGFPIPRPEGWGYFYGKPSEPGRVADFLSGYGGGDGHRAAKPEKLKETEDEYFKFVLSFLGGNEPPSKGWVFHYRAKQQPISPEFRGVFKFLNLNTANECQYYEFEPCHWRFMRFEMDEQHMFARNVTFVNQAFDAHPEHFSKGIEKLLYAQSLVEPFGMSFIPIEKEPEFPQEDVLLPIAKTVPLRRVGARSETAPEKRKHRYDVCISVAGPERPYADQLAKIAVDNGFSVFYDRKYQAQLWGKNLAIYFENIYRKWSKYCVMFVSAEYVNRMWTTLERQHALVRQLEEKGNEYILPIKAEDVEVPGLPTTIAYLGLKEHSVDEIGKMLVEKLRDQGD